MGYVGALSFGVDHAAPISWVPLRITSSGIPAARYCATCSGVIFQNGVAAASEWSMAGYGVALDGAMAAGCGDGALASTG